MMSYNKNTINIVCNKKNYKNDLNKFVKHSTNSKKHSASSKATKKRSDNNLKSIDNCNNNKIQFKINSKNHNKVSNNHNNMNNATGIWMNSGTNKEISEINCCEKVTKRLRTPSYTEVRRKKSKSKIIRNAQRTNNIIGHVEKLIKQNVDVERGARKIRENNLDYFFPMQGKLKKQAAIAVAATAVIKEHQEKNNKEKGYTKEQNPNNNYISKELPSYKTVKPQTHDSVQQIMFSRSFKERSDSSRLDHERNHWLQKMIAMDRKEKEFYVKETRPHNSSSTNEQFYDCTPISNAEFCTEYRGNNLTEDQDNNHDLQKKKSSSKMLIHFKNLLNQYLKKTSVGETKFFLSKDDIEFLRNIVEADEKYHQLHMEDHSLLKEILLSQLEEIQLHQNIVDNILKTLKVNTSEDDLKVKATSSSDSEAADAYEPSSHLRETSSEHKVMDNISWGSTSEEQLAKLLDNEDGKKMQELLQDLISRASIKQTEYNDDSTLKEKSNSEEFFLKLDAITERTEPTIGPPTLSNPINTEKEDKKLGVELKEVRYENYMIIENLPPCLTVHPLSKIIEAYTALEFIKQKMSIATLKKTKEFYIPKDGNHFELEKTNYDQLISDPNKLKRILNKKKKTMQKIQKVNSSRKTNESTSPSGDNGDIALDDEIDQIELAVALFENYSCILQSIEDVNQYIKNSIQKMENCCQTAKEQKKSNEDEENLPKSLLHVENKNQLHEINSKKNLQVTYPKITSDYLKVDIENCEKVKVTSSSIKNENKHECDFNKMTQLALTEIPADYFEIIRRNQYKLSNENEICLYDNSIDSFLLDINDNSSSSGKIISLIDSIDSDRYPATELIEIKDNIEDDFDIFKNCESLTDVRTESRNMSIKLYSSENLNIRQRKNKGNNENKTKNIKLIENKFDSDIRLIKSPSKVMQLINKTRITLIKHGVVITFQSCLFALVVSALSLPEPICL